MTVVTENYAQDRPDPKEISYRPPVAAGTFYPSNADTLRNMINRFIDTTQPIKLHRDIVGLIVPHAGYIFSGKTAGTAFREIRDKKFESIIIIAPSHFTRFSGVSVFDGDAYVTPLGDVNVDKELAKEISSVNKTVFMSREGHDWRDSVNEHAIEVELPFLQVVQPGVPIVPIIMGTQDFKTCNELMKAIFVSVKKLNRKVLIIASSDLSHYHDLNTARKMDMGPVNSIYSYDYFRMGSQFFTRRWEACGAGPIVTTMMAAEQLGANYGLPLKYSTSAESEASKHDSSKVVGYMSGVLFISEGFEQEKAPGLSDNDKWLLYDLAKKVVENTVKQKDSDMAGLIVPMKAEQMYSAFVTIKKNGELRSCMGHTYPSEQLYKEIMESAKLAATRDFRFGPLDSSEINKLSYEVSVLSRFRRVLDTNEIQPGIHGLFIRLGDSAGVFLPQVAAERHWDRQTYLESICAKAGLPKDAYKHPLAELYIFYAAIINEKNIEEPSK